MKYTPLLLCGVLALLAGCQRGEDGNGTETDIAQKDKTVPVRVKVVEPETFTVRDQYYGKVSGMREATTICFGGGRVESLMAKPGQWVKSGKWLAKIDADKAITAWETAKLNEKVAKNNYERIKNHLEAGNASQVQVDQAHLAYLNARASRIEAEKLREGALAISPISGIVVSRYVELDQQLAPGTPTFAIAQLHRMKVSIEIPEKDVGGVTVGSDAVVTFDTHPGRSWPGEVSMLSRRADPASRKFSAEIVVDNEDRTILSGITGRVNLAVRTLENNIVVPSAAVLSEGSEHAVMVVENGKAVRYPVEIGPSDENRTVLLDGIAGEARLIVEGQHLVKTGTAVRVIEESTQG
jgi:membrane fusion protein (multidrug efflux system)